MLTPRRSTRIGGSWLMEWKNESAVHRFEKTRVNIGDGIWGLKEDAILKTPVQPEQPKEPAQPAPRTISQGRAAPAPDSDAHRKGTKKIRGKQNRGNVPVPVMQHLLHASMNQSQCVFPDLPFLLLRAGYLAHGFTGNNSGLPSPGNASSASSSY